MTREKIKAIREYMRLSQEKFAQVLGVSTRTVAGWEAGKSHPTGLSIRRLEEVYKSEGLDIVDEIPGHKSAMR